MGTDNLSLTQGAGSDNLAAGSGSGQDNLAASSGSGQDNLAATSGSGQDNLEKLWLTLTTAGGTLDNATPITVNVEDTTEFPATGSATMRRRSDMAEQAFTYTGKTATTFTGCLIASGTFTFVTGDEVETV